MQAQHRAFQERREQVQEPTPNTAELRGQLQESERSHRQLQKRLNWTEDRLTDREMRLTELELGIEGLKEQLNEAHQDRQALEMSLMALLPHSGTDRHPLALHEDLMACSSLNGMQLIYVGGRNRTLPHMKALTEANDGELIHHDGGIEDSRAGLINSLQSADSVFCAIDCISHDACLRVKRHCKQQNIPFIPLRSSSLSAFSGGLQRLLQTSSSQEQDG